MLRPSSLLFSLLLVGPALANVEKTIFKGPATIRIPHEHPTLSDLRLDVLSPEKGRSSIRTHLRAEFPSSSSSNEVGEHGKATWLLLDDLTPDQRYEVRVCWAATQPTDFRLTVHEIPAVWDTPDLISSLAAYSASRLEEEEEEAEVAKQAAVDGGKRPESERRPPNPRGEHEASVLLLRILATADYFTTNASLMENVPPVHVDIILDPFILNVLPRSLIPVGGYLVVVAVLAVLVARRVGDFLHRLASTSSPSGGSATVFPHRDKKRQ